MNTIVSYIIGWSHKKLFRLGTLLSGQNSTVVNALQYDVHPMHFTLDEAVAFAKTVGAKRTFFTHIGHRISYADAMSKLPPSMELAYDGLHLSI